MSYFQNLFKIMTLTGFILFYVGLILRFTYASTDDQFVAARYDFAIFIYTTQVNRYGCLRSETARKRGVFTRNIGHSNTTPFMRRYFYCIRSYTDRIVRYGPIDSIESSKGDAAPEIGFALLEL
jgi:hypothetical protein